jgi:hypothetical protein
VLHGILFNPIAPQIAAEHSEDHRGLKTIPASSFDYSKSWTQDDVKP